MTLSQKIAFYAPIKPPDHPIPSGDRLIAQNLLKAMALAGHEVELASRYIAYSKRSDPQILASRKNCALEEADRLKAAYLGKPSAERPDIWITYHPYCKAPDWIGPVVAKALGIPYLTIEAARTGQGDETDPWGPWRAEAQNGIKMADKHLVFKPSDRAYLTNLLGSDARLFDFPTFVDLASLQGHQAAALPDHWTSDTPVLITTGMMRKGKKLTNFEMLAKVLSGMNEANWNLVVVGGGPEEPAVREAFSGIPNERIHWTGQVPHEDVLSWMRAADVFTWPGWKEPIGMVYLEAQAQGLPVVAYDSMGVPLVVEHGKSGLLAPEGDEAVMRAHLESMIANPDQRREMGKAAKARVADDHSLERAAAALNEIIQNQLAD